MHDMSPAEVTELVIVLLVVGITLYCIISKIIKTLATNALAMYYGHSSGVRLTGKYILSKLMNSYNIYNCAIKEDAAELSDCYNISYNYISLSYATANKNSVASLAISLHEFGHMLQNNPNKSSLSVMHIILDKYFLFELLIAFLIMLKSSSLLLGLWLMAAVIVLPEITCLMLELKASVTAHKLIVKHTNISETALKEFDKVLKLAFVTYLVDFPLRVLNRISIIYVMAEEIKQKENEK